MGIASILMILEDLNLYNKSPDWPLAFEVAKVYQLPTRGFVKCDYFWVIQIWKTVTNLYFVI